MRLSSRSTTALLAAFVLAVGCGQPTPPDGGMTAEDGGGSVSCAAGTQGCPCAAQNRCGKNGKGEQLVCMGNVCEAMTCPAGDRGCVCRGGSECNAAGDTCTEGFCTAANCAPGTKDCGCLVGSCDVGLRCLEGAVCVDSTGFEGGACLANGRCHTGARCDSSTNRCVFCDPGSAGCQCNQNNACNSGLTCATGLCLAASALPPANPACFTPCRDDLETDAGLRQCTTEDVIPGCLPNQTCVQGSCVEPGMSKPPCATDLDCPFFQVCLAGGCYSNCEVNADCPSGMGCDRHACRPTCAVSRGSAACGQGSACTAADGENGFCRPVGRAPASMMQTPVPTGGIELPVSSLALSNVAQTGSFMLVPRSASTQDVTIRKLWHSITDTNGTTQRVDAPKDATGQYRECNAAMNECPLWWLRLGAPGGQPAQTPTVAFRLIPGCADTITNQDAGSRQPCPSVRVENAGGVQAVRWEGALEITTRDTRATVTLSYVQRPEGQWTGAMYYFGTFGTKGMQTWIGRSTKSDVSGVENGLIQRWGALRLGNLEGWEEFLAVLTSTRTESWKFGVVDDRCKQSTGNMTGAVACYPYTNQAGVRVYVQNRGAAPIPSGVSELPFAMNLKISATDPNVFEGRVESSNAMHYPGNPALKIEFNANPAQASSCFSGGGTDCMVFLKEMTNPMVGDKNRVVSDVGGRYYPADGLCANGFVAAQVPWLLKGFTEGTNTTQSGERFRVECRDNDLPFDRNANPGAASVNQSLAGANPVPDGKPRRRTLSFLDGALVNQSELFILFEERYESFIPGQAPTVAYGYLRLKRAPADLRPESFVGLTGPSSLPTRPVPDGGAVCNPGLVRDTMTTTNGGPPANTAEKVALAAVLMGGTSAGSAFQQIGDGVGQAPTASNQIHYYCEDTGRFNGGNGDDGSPNGVRIPCPPGSNVTYFNAGTLTAAEIASERCNTDLDATQQVVVSVSVDGGTVRTGRARCGNRLQEWRLNNQIVEASPLYQCAGGQPFCDDNRLNLRAGKIFYRRTPQAPSRTFLPLIPLIDSAFRYKTRFRSSVSGTSLGFAPQICVPGSDQIPYCYDPAQIEEARQRVDCLVALYSDPVFAPSFSHGTQGQQVRTQLYRTLRQSFSEFRDVATAPDGGAQRSFEGFERLNAELLVMQGDESLTAAYASRFDLAATGGASFKGSAFEPNGIDLTGVAGAEMFRLYEAVQYYQLALDRMYMLGPNMRTALSRGTSVLDDAVFISPEMVTSYLERLVRAASQKARSYAEIARRYQNFNRPDLARRVIERAYVATYLESALISYLMLDIAERSNSAALPQIKVTIEKSQRNYRMALLDMREMYQQITDEQNFFGYPPEYIPFPSLDSSSVSSANAYEALAQLARQRLDLAKTRETTALSSGRQGRVDAAQFQSDLTSIRNNYENQLSQICGTFRADDSRLYPAIQKYAHLNQTTMLMGDPCGRMGSGELHNAMGQVKDTSLRLKSVLQRHENVLREIDIERSRVAQQCMLTQTVADYQFNRGQQVISMQQEMAESRAMMTFIGASLNAVVSSIQVLDCEIQCASSAAMAATVAGAGIAAAGTQYATELRVAQTEANMREFELETMRFVTESQCTAQQIDSTARVANLFNNTMETQLEALRTEYGVRLAMADVTRLASTAQRLQAQQEEAEQLAINVQAAQNDPNVRIYQNDAVINADVSFKDALATAYRLTRVFEYYTSQSYAKKEQLFLIRMVTAGQYNLENYLLELDNAFNTFEEQFGNPDVRVIALSLRDDIMQIPLLKQDRTPLTENERINMMRERLRDVRLLDSRGYLTLPFSTELRALSPLTRNHKIRHVEIDLQGARMGDAMSRIYMRMSGTGVVRNVDDDLDYYVFPERLAVVNASLLGAKVYDPEVYRNYRFRDRPLVNTLWELVVNQRDELVNQDIDLQSLTDIRVLIYYSDFTAF